MVGSVISAMVTTVAPTTPLAAASSTPTSTTEMPKPARQRAEQAAHRFEQVLGDARALQHHAHEDEQRDGEQHRVGHHAEHALRQRVEEPDVHRASEMRQHREGERHAAERERDRIAGEQQRADRDHHQDGEEFGERHQRGAFAALRRPMRSIVSIAIDLIACERPCSASSAAKTGIKRLQQKHQRQGRWFRASAQGSPRSAPRRATRTR